MPSTSISVGRAMDMKVAAFLLNVVAKRRTFSRQRMAMNRALAPFACQQRVAGVAGKARVR